MQNKYVVIAKKPEERVIYIHKESGYYLTHKQWAKAMKESKSWVTPLTINLHKREPLPYNLPLNPQELQRSVTSYEIKMEEIPYSEDWTMKVLTDLEEEALLCMIDNTGTMDVRYSNRAYLIDRLTELRELEYRNTQLSL